MAAAAALLVLGALGAAARDACLAVAVLEGVEHATLQQAVPIAMPLILLLPPPLLLPLLLCRPTAAAVVEDLRAQLMLLRTPSQVSQVTSAAAATAV